MITPELIKALIEKNAFATDTIITARYTSVDLFGRIFNKNGDFKLRKITKNPGQHIFELADLNSSSYVIKATANDIVAVDGMDIHRFADIYDILPDGSRKKVGRKRGRKPKQLSA
jgi:hypothetical protein